MIDPSLPIGRPRCGAVGHPVSVRNEAAVGSHPSLTVRRPRRSAVRTLSFDIRPNKESRPAKAVLVTRGKGWEGGRGALSAEEKETLWETDARQSTDGSGEDAILRRRGSNQIVTVVTTCRVQFLSMQFCGGGGSSIILGIQSERGGRWQ